MVTISLQTIAACCKMSGKGARATGRYHKIITHPGQSRSCASMRHFAAISELETIMERHACGHLIFSPVFLRLTVEDCKKKLASLLKRGATRFSIS